ncbi:39S ribosomal protein L3, mitochondrial [Schistosoma japonicum]|nr:39S ribosomal protein L3, mitochondrial [Schistosoma japonicum]KAH8873694.1 39S ribosomal protein L3, mitochondrial [Schistosoma japonicum]KAH8873695.1 39S ribosomal protein L3, mitochondrial [Schistosoma japonicum]KAH8873697.1 39S ribosomal protein L3, mitochondrial [Schistosoma japonicum]KAH8873698.1 39S ribosomal protein L3, mitochondrial [Schistosoma japonicum]
MFGVYAGAFFRMNIKFIYKEPIRFMGSLNKVVYPWMNKKKPFWVTQEANPYADEDITPENKEFLERQRIEALTTSPIITEQWTQVPWTPYVTQRCGLIAIKLGVYPLWTKTGEKMDCTVFQVPDNHALRYTPPSEIDKYISLLHPRHYWLNSKRPPSWITQKRWGIQLVGAFSADPIEFTPEWCGLFKEAGVPPKRKISRFLVSPDAALKPGTPLSVHHFRVGDYLDITARTINRGFQGVIERWGMKGGPAAHGSTKFHRRMGSAAGCGGPIARGKRMPGVMGNRFRSLRGVMIVRINPKLGLIYVPGATPGPVHAYCLLHDSWLANRQRRLDANPPPVPTCIPSIVNESNSHQFDSTFSLDDDDDFDQDIYHESIHPSCDPSISYSEDSA